MREQLLKKQRALTWTDARMAELLGIPRTTYSAFKNGRLPLSLKMARAIVRAFPDLEPYTWRDTTESAQPQKPVEAA
jgi:DNA-binding XRE family transcriptional regulator